MTDQLIDEQSLIVRFLDVLRASADADGRGHVTNRVLGHALGCSIGNFPKLWRRLAAKELLVIERSDRMGTVYRLLAPGEAPPATPAVRAALNANPARKELDDLERLARLKERGHLTDREFAILKRRLVADDGSE